MSLREELISYSQAIIDGKITACRKHRWACQRFVRDIERSESNDPDFPYEFEPELYEYKSTGQPMVGIGWRKLGDTYGPGEEYLNFMMMFKHRKGAIAGRQKVPVDYEKFVYGNIYGWRVRGKPNVRRFRRMYEQLARKQAKSQDKGIQALFEISVFGEPSAEAYVAATKKEQTRFVWGEAKWLYQNSEFRNSFTCKFDEELKQVVIKHVKSGSFFSRLSKDDKKTGDGANPHFVVLDEYHLHDTTEYYDLATSGMKTRVNPLLSIITTAGFDLNNPCYRVEYDYVSKILDPDNPIENDRYFAIVCEVDVNDTGNVLTVGDRNVPPGGIIDDVNSDDAIDKANPVTGKDPITRENIRLEIAEGYDKPEKMRDVMTKTLNIWVNQRERGYLNMAKWGACRAIGPVDVSGLRPVAGLDLSSTVDLTALGFEFLLGDGRYYVRSHAFIPQEKLEEKRRTDKVPYDLWAEQGWITITPGAMVDYHLVFGHIEAEYARNGWPKGEICYDKTLATWLTGELDEAGFVCVEIPQSFTGLSTATKDFRAKVYDGKIVHDGDPLLSWAISNAITRAGPSENIMLDKAKSRERIDPIAAVINAHTRAMVSESTCQPRAAFF